MSAHDAAGASDYRIRAEDNLDTQECAARGDVITIDFSSALAQLKAGQAVSRVGWNGPDQYIRLQRPDYGSKMTLPYLYIKTVQNDFVPWLASQTDLLANDWYIVDSVRTIEERMSL